MGEIEKVSKLIGDTYDAALDPALWPSLLESTCAYVQAVSGGIFVAGAVPRSSHVSCDWGCDPEVPVNSQPVTCPPLRAHSIH